MTTEVFVITGTATHALRDARHRFTVDDYYRMAETGILEPDDRVELLDGQVVEMSPSGSRHAACIRILTQLITDGLGARGLISAQLPVRLDQWNEPEPDIAILKARKDSYLHAHPGPADVLLIVEIGDSSASADRLVKLLLYARFGITEVWLVDLQAGHLEMHRHPSDGTYSEVTRVKPPAKVQPEAFPDIHIDSARLFLR